MAFRKRSVSNRLHNGYSALSHRQQHLSKPKDSEGQSVGPCILLVSVTEGLSLKVVVNMCMRFNLMFFYCRHLHCDMFLLKLDVLSTFKLLIMSSTGNTKISPLASILLSKSVSNASV